MKSFTITFNGPFVSQNQQKRGSWYTKVSPTRDLKLLFKSMWREVKAEGTKSFSIHVKHRTRLDNDNIISTIKPGIDALTALGLIPDDTCRYWKRLTVEPDKLLPANTLNITFQHEED
jgi:hypothetical protein